MDEFLFKKFELDIQLKLYYNKRKKDLNMYKRRVQLNKIYSLSKRTKVLVAQEQATKEIKNFCYNIDFNNTALEGNGDHAHVCTFKMLSNDRGWQKAQCKKWLKKHPIISKNIIDSSDYCDYCAMFNYVALDDEGKVMYVSRTFPQEIYEWEKKYYENNNS